MRSSERAWAPLGVDRFYNMVKYHYLDNSTTKADNDAAFFRVVPQFVVQFGIAGSPAVSGPWENAEFKDDPVVLSNVEGTIAFATAGPNTRTTQVRGNPLRATRARTHRYYSHRTRPQTLPTYSSCSLISATTRASTRRASRPLGRSRRGWTS
jgi:hypothetical protein